MPGDTTWMRRHAIQIAAQLPERTEDALMVLELARKLVQTFLVDDREREPAKDGGAVVAFPASSNSR